MTRFHFTLLSLLILFASCSGSLNQQGPCTVNIVCDAPGYTKVDLFDINNNPLDTTLYLNDGIVSFSRIDSVDMPYLAMLRFRNSDPLLDLELPIAIEKGEVNASIGETVLVSGTPLNSNLQSFLNSRAKLGAKVDKEVLADTTLQYQEALSKMQSMYSEFYRDVIIDNADNPIGLFVFRQYNHVLNLNDKEKVEQKLKKNL